MKTKQLLSILVCLGALQSAVFALAITPDSGVILVTRWEGPQTVPAVNPSQSAINAALEAIVSGITSKMLYNADPKDGESGDLASSYGTVFAPDNDDPSAATITYGIGNTVGGTAYMLVKDGKHDPSWYFYNLTSLGWNGTETLELSDFWPQGGAISHVSLYGTATPSIITPTPDGGTTVALLGLSLVGLGFLRRKLV